MSLAELMRRDWDKRASKDAYFYIASWRNNWDEASFLQSGEEDYQRFVMPVFERYQISPRDKTMLELGSGTGRMTRSFAQRFSRVVGVDISTEMLDRARLAHHRVENIMWVQGNGTDLSNVPSAAVDFVFSYLVLQHLPAETLVYSYVREILRILTTGGICLFQYNGTPDKHMNWKGRAVWGLLDTLRSMRFNGAIRMLAKSFNMDPEMAGRSWHGVSAKHERLREAVRSGGGFVLEFSGVNTPMAWCCARKISEGEGTHAQ
jgi:ubiquinone/menaquinone biosynthesis C-methylase UbiE